MEQKQVRVGDLLTAAGILRKEDLAEAIQIAVDTGQMIGKVLVMSGYLSKQSLQVALDAQSLLRDRLIEYNSAIQAMNDAAERNVSLAESLKSIGWTPRPLTQSAKLGELLSEANLITSQELERSLSLSTETGQPLGTSLIALKIVKEDLLLHALDVQASVREGQMTRSEAVAELSKSAQKTNS